MKYKAIKPGFFNGSRVRAGQVFEADSFNGSWAEPQTEEKVGVASAAPVSKKPAKKKRKRKTSKKKQSKDQPSTK